MAYAKQFQPHRQLYLTRLYCEHGFIRASKGGHLNIVRVVLENYFPCLREVGRALKWACSTCSWDVIFFLHKKFKITQINGLREACVGKHRKLVDWLIKNGDDDWNAGLAGACISGDVSLIRLMIDRGATDIKNGFQRTCEEGHVEASKYFLESGTITTLGRHLNYIRHMKVKKLLLEYDHRYTMTVFATDICPLLNEGVSLQTLSRYKHVETMYLVGLAEKLFQVVQLSLWGHICSDLVNLLKSFIGYDVSKQIMDSMRWHYGR